MTLHEFVEAWLLKNAEWIEKNKRLPKGEWARLAKFSEGTGDRMTALQAPIDIQAKLDELLASSPEAQKYIAAVWYVPAGTVAPVEVTHLLQLSSSLSTARMLTIGLVVKPPYAAALDALLALAATQ